MSSPTLFDRRCNVLIAGKSGDALDVGELTVRFSIKRNEVQSPNWADVTIYNLKNETAARLKAEGTRIVIQAGYQDLYGVIFDGQIEQARIGRESAIDSFLSIAAADGSVAYNEATVNTTLEAGATANSMIDTAIAALSEKGVSAGFVEDLGGPELPRGKVMFGMARDHVRGATRGLGATWSIQNGKVEVLKRSGRLPGQAVVLTPSSGLVGIPIQTERGIEAQHLIIPTLRVGGAFKLDRSLILEAQKQAPSSSSSGRSTAEKPPVPIAADGLYRIIITEYQGDTRGNDWYVTVVGLPIGSTGKGGEEVNPA